MVEKEAYLLELARYVVLNPVRAHMVADAAEWPWSSYRCMTGQTPTPLWLQTDALLGRFGLQRDEAVMRFIDFVRAGVDQPPLWDKLKGQIYLGDDAFLEKMSALVNDTIQEVPLTQRRPVVRDLRSYTQNPGDRDTAMAQAFATGAFTMRAIADVFGVHFATVSRAVYTKCRTPSPPSSILRSAAFMALVPPALPPWKGWSAAHRPNGRGLATLEPSVH